MRIASLFLSGTLAAGSVAPILSAASPPNPLIGRWRPVDPRGGACAAQVIFAGATQTDVTVQGAAPIAHRVQHTMSPGMVYATSSGGSSRWDVNADGTITLNWPSFCDFHLVE